MSKVSIIIPIYNTQKYMNKTIDSVMNQTVKDIEIILVDDGSTDNSGKICDEYALKDNRIKVIHKQNGGLSSARNAGTVASSGEYILFLDGDDYLRCDAVEVCLDAMQKYPCDFVQFRYQEIAFDKEPTITEPNEKIYQAHTKRELFENLYKLGGVAASGATKFMRRSLAISIPFENILHEDEMWCTRAFRNDLTVTYIPDELYYYVMREGSIMHSTFHKKMLDKITVSEERLKVLLELGLTRFLQNEYSKLFLTILNLYIGAKTTKNDLAKSIIKSSFIKHKYNFNKYAKLSGKFAFIYKLMCVNYCFINIYLWYWSVKKLLCKVE